MEGSPPGASRPSPRSSHEGAGHRGAGFIGSNLVRALAADGDTVRVLDDPSTGRQDNLDGVAGDVEVIEGDVRDPRPSARRVAGVEVVHHLAALPSVARSVADPAPPTRSTSTAPSPSCSGRRTPGCGGVYASSSSVYGDTLTLPKHEDMPVSPCSPYGAAKLAGEAYCRAFAGVYPLETVCLRFFNVFGPRQDLASQYAAVVPRFVTRMLAGRPAEVIGDGRQTRTSPTWPTPSQPAGWPPPLGRRRPGSLNIGCNERISVLDLVQLINDRLPRPVEPVFTTARPGDVRDSQAAIAKAERLVGYHPLVPVRRRAGRDRGLVRRGSDTDEGAR